MKYRLTLISAALFYVSGFCFSPVSHAANLDSPRKKEIAMQLVSSAENSTLDWRKNYSYIDDIHDGRGYTAGLIGFCSATGDMLDLIEAYTQLVPSNALSPYLPTLRKRAVDRSASHDGLGAPFRAAWKNAAKDQSFQGMQETLRDDQYFNPAVSAAKKDGLGALGQFIYYDAIVLHGPGTRSDSFGGIRAEAKRRAKSPAHGGSEVVFLNAFLDVRREVMLEEDAHEETDRVDLEQRRFLREGNLNLNTPLRWTVYGDSHEITDYVFRGTGEQPDREPSSGKR